ncbi:MAG: YihY/virulence factor BrkB family protein [Ruminococcus sp.]|nr:YihY/virulence factor BrkB family protein [Ruminococcus sp.]
MSGKKKLIAKTKYFLDKSRIDNISAISAQSAFFLVLSIVPFLMFAFAVLSFFNIPDNVYEAYIKQAFPTELNNYLKDFISTAYDNSVGVAFTTIIAALWSAGKGMYSITEGINRIYKIRKKQLWIIKRVFAMGYTLLMFLALVAAVVLLMIGEFFDGFIMEYIENLPAVIGILYALRYLLVFSFAFIIISVALKLYLRGKVKDKRWAKFRLQLPGVFLTALCWLGLSYGIRIYVKYFNGFSIYGSLIAIAVVMIWIYFAMYILLYGIQFNYVNRREFYNFHLRRKRDVDKNV